MQKKEKQATFLFSLTELRYNELYWNLYNLGYKI